MIPLISSICNGPLDVCHLPRFWWKAILRAKGLLDEEYPDMSGGLDTNVLNTLGLDPELTLAYLRSEIPSYLTFESWVLKQKDGAIDRAATDAWNDSVRNRVHTRPEMIEATYNDIGWNKDEISIDSAVILNSVQDWQLLHKRDLDADYSAFGNQVVPLIATIDYGRLEVCQLPRTWYKITMRAKGLLHDEYPDMRPDSGLDMRVLNALRINQDRVVAHVREKLPDFVQFEQFILDESGGQIDRAAADAWNKEVRERIHNDAKQADIKGTLKDYDVGHVTSAVLLNQIEDWHFAHQQLVHNT
jgi:hypothetical protein